MLTSDLFANFIIGVVFLNALDALGGSLTCGIFLVLAMFSLILIYRLAPETKWHQLKSIRRYWYNGGRWPEKAETRAQDSDHCPWPDFHPGSRERACGEDRSSGL